MWQLNINRCHRLIKESIHALDVDLSGLVVLTEAATGPFALTASIAALAGAEQILIVAQDSRYGTKDDAIKQTLDIAQIWGHESKLITLESRLGNEIGSADIVTNLRGVRPLNRELLVKLKSTAVIPLMYETWEFRSEDIDLDVCKKRGLTVLGTNERYPDIDVLSYIGPLSLKMLIEAGIEIYCSHIVVLGNEEFSDISVNALHNAGAKVTRLHLDREGKFDVEYAKKVFIDADALLIMEHRIRRTLIGKGGCLNGSEIVKINPGLVIVHITGNTEREELANAGLICYPEIFSKPGYMSVTTADLGPRPLINLHLAGLKVGEIMARARRRGLSADEVEREALLNPICQAFS